MRGGSVFSLKPSSTERKAQPTSLTRYHYNTATCPLTEEVLGEEGRAGRRSEGLPGTRVEGIVEAVAQKGKTEEDHGYEEDGRQEDR